MISERESIWSPKENKSTPHWKEINNGQEGQKHTQHKLTFGGNMLGINRRTTGGIFIFHIFGMNKISLESK